MNPQEVKEAKERISSLKVLMVSLDGRMVPSLSPEQYMAKAVEYNDAIEKLYKLEKELADATKS